MRLLLVANPGAYRDTATDVPLGYARLAAHPVVELYHADTRDMLATGDAIRATPVPPGFTADDFHDLPHRSTVDYASTHFDLAFCRTLKPFPAGYLERLAERASSLRFLNHPAGIRRQLEPSFLLEAAGEFLPPSLITADEGLACRFQARHGAIVAKRVNSSGGRGVYRIAPLADGAMHMDNIVEGERDFGGFSDLFAALSSGGTEPLLLMRFLPRVVEGDKRIVVVDGEIYGAYLRTSPRGHWVQNVAAGSQSRLAEVNDTDRRVVDATSGHYRGHGIHILGYDLLTDDDGQARVSEINAGNIGGLFRLETLGVTGITERFVRWLRQSNWQAKRATPGVLPTAESLKPLTP